ncbi:MAG: hypothetical protein DRG82_17395, partial [Deltaproteobacteria bacterium]
MGCFLSEKVRPYLFALLAGTGLWWSSLEGAGSSITAGAFASYPVSVRGAGMGGVYTAVSHTSGAPY